MPNFYHKVLPSLREIVHIESSENDEELIRTILPPEPEFITYLDVDSGNLVGRADVYYDNTRFALTDLLNNDSPESFRSFEAEGSMLDLLLRYLPHYDPSYRILFAPKDAELTFDLLDRGIPEILQRLPAADIQRPLLRKIDLVIHHDPLGAASADLCHDPLRHFDLKIPLLIGCVSHMQKQAGVPDFLQS